MDRVSTPSTALTDPDARVIRLLRRKGLSIKRLDDDQKQEVVTVIRGLHVDRGVSLNDIALLIGNKTSGYTSWLCRQLGIQARPFEVARLKGIREKRRKYERRPFNGTDEDKAYLLGLRHGDLSVSRPWKGVVRVSTSTTHPAMARLFHTLFGPFGHVYQYPRYKKDIRAYGWNLQVILDDTFSFLLDEFLPASAWVEEVAQRVLAYLSGFLDAEGSILVTRDSRKKATLFVDYFNEDKAILEWVETQARKLGLGCSLRVNKPRGRGTSGYHLFHNRDYWQLSIFGKYTVRRFIESLCPRHTEKSAKRVLALSVSPGQPLREVAAKVVQLRTRIKSDVDAFVKQAEVAYLASHSESSVVRR